MTLVDNFAALVEIVPISINNNNNKYNDSVIISIYSGYFILKICG